MKRLGPYTIAASLICLAIGALPSTISAQSDSQLASVALPDNPAPASPSRESERVAHETRDATFRSFVPDFIHDQKGIWIVYPSHLFRGKHWVPTLAVTGVTAGLIFADPHIMTYFRSHQTNIDDVNDVFGPIITTGEVVSIPAGIMLMGYARHDEYAVSTAILSGEAYADSIIPNLAIKAVTRRERPADVPAPNKFTDTFFNPNKSAFKGSSFPSGHATGAFAVATVISQRYRNHRWVPWVMYGFAGAVSLSRVSTMAHFPSDVFVGAAMGYTVARYQTLRPR